MKRLTNILVSSSLALAMISLQGCYGKMALTKKVYALNGEVNDKFVRSLVTWAFIFVPVYGVSALADFVLFNTIEFWTGKNPVAQGEKQFRYASNGETFEIHARKTGDSVHYLIDRYQGQTYRDTMSIAWDLKSGNSKAIFSDASKVTEFTAIRENDGIKVSKREQGISERVPELLALYR